MKRIIIVAVVLMITNTSFGQYRGESGTIQQGKIIIEPYYGFPNWQKVWLRVFYTTLGVADQLVFGGFGPIGTKAEYLITDNIGLGVDFWYVKATITWFEDDKVYNSSTGNYNKIRYSHTYTMNKWSLLANFNYHFANSDTWDVFVTGGVGYKAKRYTVVTNNPNYSNEESVNLIPVEARLAISARYFITDFIGVGIAVGFFGPTFNGGIVVKI